MSVHLVCDQCGRDQDHPPIKPDRIGGMVEIRGVTDTNIGEVHRADYPLAQVHWQCLVPFIERQEAKWEEAPF